MFHLSNFVTLFDRQSFVLYGIPSSVQLLVLTNALNKGFWFIVPQFVYGALIVFKNSKSTKLFKLKGFN